jgi:uncharacterized membrane protein YbhN (UPF0104 family)
MSDSRSKAGGAVEVSEPALRRRVRRPSDLFRLVLVLVGLVGVVALGDVAVGTASGLEQDLIGAGSGVPHVLLQLLDVVTRAGVVVVPVVAGVDLVARGRSWQMLDAAAAAAAAVTISWLSRMLIVSGHLGGVVDALTKVVHGGGRTPALDVLLVASVAFLTVADVVGRRLLHPMGLLFVGSATLTGFLSGGVTGLALLCSLLLGWAVGLAVRYGHGAASTRPDGAAVADALTSCGVALTRLELVSEPGGTRRYVGTSGGDQIDVVVLDRDTYGSTTARRAMRRLRLRGSSSRSPSLTVRAAVEHQSLMALTLAKLGVLAPEPLAACQVGPAAALIAFRRPAAVALSSGHDAELSAERLQNLWRLLSTLQTAKIAHRGLEAANVLLAADDQVGLAIPGGGDIAAADLALRLDTAQLLTTVALRTSPEAAVGSATLVLGPQALVRALALLQPVALGRSTRQELRQHKHLLHDLRAEVLRLVPPGQSVDPVELRRLTARTLVTVVGGAVAAYVLLTQLARVNVAHVLASADWIWVLGVVAFTTLTFTGAALVISGAVATKLTFTRTYLTQLAVAFSGLVAPSAIGNIALNTRYLQRSGVEPAVAGASVALAQLAQFSSYFVLLVVSGVLAGTSPQTSLAPPVWLVVGLIVLAAGVAVAVVLPIGRRFISRRLLPLVQQVIPRVVSVFQHPSKVASLFGGALLLDTSFVAALTCATRAFGVAPPIATVAVVYFAGAIVGSAVPTPGGLGGIEAALTAGLIAAGTPSSLAVSSVLLYRLSTYWLPIPFGWISLNYLQRASAI